MKQLPKLQVEKMLLEISVKQKYRKLLDTWFEHFKKFLSSMPQHGEINLSEMKKKKEVRKFPHQGFINKLLNLSGGVDIKTDQDVVLKFVRPEGCSIFNVHKSYIANGPELTAFVNIIIPKKCFLEKDYLNNRFVVKREFYLWYICTHLLETELLYGDSTCIKTNLSLQIVPNVSKKIKIHLYVTPAESSFKLSRFEPDRNNIREHLFDLFDDLDCSKLRDFGTPYYNSLLLNKLTVASNYTLLESKLEGSNYIKDAIKLLSVWLRQRGLDVNGFSDDIMVQLILYLFLKNQINNHMSPYQVIRQLWLFISTTDWHEKPISICEDVKDDKLELFRKHFDVVFLDHSGCYNLTALINLNVYSKLKQEAEFAVKVLDDDKFDPFETLFMTKMKPEVQYDALLSLYTEDNFKTLYNSTSDDLKCTYVGCLEQLIINRILSFLNEGLGRRVHYIVPLIETESGDESLTKITFGLILNPSTAFTCLEKGPPADSPEAAKFRSFWGDLSECRMFANGSICEAVYFHAETFQEKRKIFKTIIDYIVTKKLQVEKYEVVADEFDQTLSLENCVEPLRVGSCEESSLKAITNFDDLSKIIRGFSLPLEITAIQSACEVFSYTNVFPPVPINHQTFSNIRSTLVQGNNIILRENVTIVPKYVEPIDCVIQLGMSYKWPNNLEALRQLKIGFYLELSKLLGKKRIVTSVKPGCLDVLYRGLVFRFRLYHPKEISIMKRYAHPDGLIGYKDTPESIEMEKQLNIIPKIVGALNGLQSQYCSFGPSTSLIKRWLGSQLIDDCHIPNIVISLLNASLYLNYGAPNNPNLPQLAFIRFLQFIANIDWNLEFVIVNFNSEFTKTQLDEIEADFQNNRHSYPFLYIACPFDEGKSLFSKHIMKEILNRLSTLAKGAYEYIHFNILKANFTAAKELFVANMEGYNVLIHLNPCMNAKSYQQLLFLASDGHQFKSKSNNERECSKMPVVGFNPVQCYLKELRQHYADIALFFYDPYGGNVIGVLWYPKVLEDKDFKVSHVAGRKLMNKKLVLNTSTIIQDFYELGKGLVTIIEKKN